MKGTQTKAGQGRVVLICKALQAWLSRYREGDICHSGYEKDFAQARVSTGYGTKTDEKPDLKPWVPDG